MIYSNMKNILDFRFLAIALSLTFLVGSCADDDDPTPQGTTNKTEGFVIVGTTSSGTALVSYSEDLPTGTVDLSAGEDFQRFSPTALYDHALFMSRPDGSSGFAKIVVDDKGEFQEEGVLPTVDPTSFRIGVRDAEVGLFHDRATPDIITVYNPTTFEVTGTIDMDAGIDPFDTLEQRYQRFIFRGDEVFSPIRGNVGGELLPGFFMHQANVATRSYVGSTFVEAPLSGGVLTVNNFGQHLVDNAGNLYVQDGGAIGSGTFSRIYKIPAGSNKIDENYVFEPVKTLNPTNIFYPTMNGFKLVDGSGIAVAKVNAETPQAAIDLVNQAGGIQNVVGNQDLLNQILGILFTAESASWVELDLNAQTVTPIVGVPKMGANAGGSVIFEHDGEIYLPVSTTGEQAYYKYTPGNPTTASKAFDIIGADLLGVYNVENNN